MLTAWRCCRSENQLILYTCTSTTAFKNTSLTSPHMHDSWNPILRDVALWVINPSPPDQHKFGHIRGQYATAKSVIVPPLFRKALRDAGSNVPILHVMAQFKKAEVLKSRSGEDCHDIQNVDYVEATAMLKDALQPSG